MQLFPLFVGACLTVLPSFALEIVGHRGASHDAPENTLPSFRLGFEQKADGVELDIHLTKDGKIIVMHDGDTKRTGETPMKIADHTFDELRQISVGGFGPWKSHPMDIKAPSLAEVLEIIPPGKRLFTEIKVHNEILPALGEAFKNGKPAAKQLPIITFHFDVAKAAKEKFPDHEVYWLYGWSKDKATGEYPKIDELIQKAKEAKLDGLDLQSGFPIDREFVKKVHDAGMKLYTWTVDDPAVARAEMEAGVDGITTNRPLFLREQLGLAQ